MAFTKSATRVSADIKRHGSSVLPFSQLTLGITGDYGDRDDIALHFDGPHQAYGEGLARAISEYNARFFAARAAEQPDEQAAE